MIDINLVRDNPKLLEKSLSRRGKDIGALKEIEALDQLWRKSTQKLELLQAKSNQLSKNKDLATKNKTELTSLKKEILEVRDKVNKSQGELEAKLLNIPNLVDEDSPAGGEENNKILESFGDPNKEKTVAHEESLTREGSLILDVAAKYSGSRFRYLSNKAAVAQRKMFDMAIDFAVSKGFVFVIPPSVANEDLMNATGFFPSGRDDTFTLDKDRFLVGTSEPLLLALGANKKHKLEDLPVRMVGFSSCFRKEVGSYGKDVKGMFRVHQFDKVELVSITSPEKSKEEHDFLIELQKEFVKKFSLPFQTVLMAAGDQSQIANKQVDLECHFPSQQRYRETHSASNCTDYQSRMLKIKVVKDGKTEFAHTLNATLATERLLLAIVENNTDKDGSINWPRELVK